MSKRFGILGGDLRQVYLMQFLRQQGYLVSCFGFDKGCPPEIPEDVEIQKDFNSFLLRSDALLLPLPVSKNGVEVNMPYGVKQVPLSILDHEVGGKQLVFGGMLPQTLFQNCRHVYDYFRKEDFTIKNAAATAEGVLALAIEKMPVTLCGCSCLVTGYGRISKCLLRLLQAAGANITVAVRRTEDAAWLHACGIPTLSYPQLKEANSFDLVFNTVPHIVFHHDELAALPKNAVLFDLASAPGGIDLPQAQSMELEVLPAPSLPGRFSPKSAGIFIGETVLNIIREENLWEN